MKPSFFERGQSQRGSVNYGLVIGVLVGIVLIGGAVAFLLTRPPAEDQRAQTLQGAFREGSPEFTAVTKDIIISTDDKTRESPTGMGTISMFIVGNVRNRGNKTFTVLEVNSAVIDQQNRVLKEKNVLVVPERTSELAPGESVPVTLALEGFDPKADRANIRWKVTALKTAN